MERQNCLLWDDCKSLVTWDARKEVFLVENCTCVGQNYVTTAEARSYIGFLNSAPKERLIERIQEMRGDWTLVTTQIVKLVESES